MEKIEDSVSKTNNNEPDGIDRFFKVLFIVVCSAGLYFMGYDMGRVNGERDGHKAGAIAVHAGATIVTPLPDGSFAVTTLGKK